MGENKNKIKNKIKDKSKNKNKEKIQGGKNTIIMGIIGIIVGAITLPLLDLIGVTGFWTFVGSVIIYYLIFRLLLILIQHILIKFKILEYSPDDVAFYAEIYGGDVKSREKTNAKYKRQLDRYRAAILYVVSMFISCTIIFFVFLNEGIISAIILSAMVAFPLIFFLHEPWDDGTGSYKTSTNYSSKPAETPKKEIKPDFSIRTGDITDEFGNIKGQVSTITYSNKYGTYETTEYTDRFGNVKGKINKYH